MTSLYVKLELELEPEPEPEPEPGSKHSEHTSQFHSPETAGDVLIWPPADAAVGACVRVKHILPRLARRAQPAARVALLHVFDLCTSARGAAA